MRAVLLGAFLSFSCGSIGNSFVLKAPDPYVEAVEHQEFKCKIAELESSHRYHVVNQIGMMGKYQFSKRTLKHLVKRGYLEEYPKNFVKDQLLQERAMDSLISYNRTTLIELGAYGYIGCTIDSLEITEERLLAGAHFVGPVALLHYLETGSLKPFRKGRKKLVNIDVNGTSVLEYMRKI